MMLFPRGGVDLCPVIEDTLLRKWWNPAFEDRWLGLKSAVTTDPWVMLSLSTPYDSASSLTSQGDGVELTYLTGTLGATPEFMGEVLL